jgi:hypothetical protein
VTFSTRTASVDTRAALAGAALALALLASIIGGVIGGVVAGIGNGPQAPAADDPPGVVVLESKWVDYGNDWERRYRQMYPGNAE